MDAPKGGHKRSPFRGAWSNTLTVLEREIEHLRGTDIIVQVALGLEDIRNDGWPRSNVRPRTPDVRVSFQSKIGPLLYECNTFDSWEQNIRAIALGLERLRAVDRYGITKANEQYKGWKQLPAGGAIEASEWPNTESAAKFLMKLAGWQVPVADVLHNPRPCWIDASKNAHPDTGGSDVLMAQVNRARDYIEKSKAA